MKNKYILLFLFGFFGIHASAQTLAQAKYSMKRTIRTGKARF